MAGDLVDIWGPFPHRWNVKLGRYRAHMVILSTDRAKLHFYLRQWWQKLVHLPRQHLLRLSIDVDPQEFGLNQWFIKFCDIKNHFQNKIKLFVININFANENSIINIIFVRLSFHHAIPYLLLVFLYLLSWQVFTFNSNLNKQEDTASSTLNTGLAED